MRRLHPEELDRIGGEPAPDLIHAHHAVHCGPAALAVAEGLDRPLVLGLGGTDLHAEADGLPDPRGFAALAGATLIIGPFAADEVLLRRSLPDAAPFHVVRRGMTIGAPPGPPRLRGPGDDFRVLFAGGLRRVKDPLRALDWAQALRRDSLPLVLVLAGPPIDRDLATAVETRCAAGPDRWLGPVEPTELLQLMSSFDMLWNSSASEGAANAILEAWSMGLPVAARATPGNRDLLLGAPPEIAQLVPDDDPTLCSLRAFVRERMKETPNEARARIESARRWLRLRHDAQDEIRDLEAAYAVAVARHSGRSKGP